MIFDNDLENLKAMFGKYITLKVRIRGSENTKGTEIIKGMTFHQTFVYLTLATAVYRSLSSGIEWDMCFSMLTG